MELVAPGAKGFKSSTTRFAAWALQEHAKHPRDLHLELVCADARALAVPRTTRRPRFHHGLLDTSAIRPASRSRTPVARAQRAPHRRRAASLTTSTTVAKQSLIARDKWLSCRLGVPSSSPPSFESPGTRAGPSRSSARTAGLMVPRPFSNYRAVRVTLAKAGIKALPLYPRVRRPGRRFGTPAGTPAHTQRWALYTTHGHRRGGDQAGGGRGRGGAPETFSALNLA
jgi:hypothetical protein